MTNQLGPRWWKIWFPVDHWAALYAHCNKLAGAKWHTHSTTTDLRLTRKAKNVGGGPAPGDLHPFPQIVGIILPVVSLWNYPTHKNDSHYSQNDLLWVSDDGFKVQGASAFGVGMIRDYVVTDGYIGYLYLVFESLQGKNYK